MGAGWQEIVSNKRGRVVVCGLVWQHNTRGIGNNGPTSAISVKNSTYGLEIYYIQAIH